MGLAIEAASGLALVSEASWLWEERAGGTRGKGSFSVTTSKREATMDFAKLISILSSCGVISLPGKSRQFFLRLRANPSDGAHVCRPNVVALQIHLLFKQFVTLGSTLLLALCLPHLQPDCPPTPTQKVQAFTMGEHPPQKQLPQKTSYSKAPGERGSFARTSPCKLGSSRAWKLCTYLPVQTWPGEHTDQ